MPIKHDARRASSTSTRCSTDPIELALLFSANRAYFLVDMEVPSAYVEFLRDDACPTRRPPSSTRCVGLQKHGKTLFFRDFLHHLKHSTDRFVVAPGIKGLVMMRVHAAVVSVRVQGDPRPHRAVARTPTRARVKQKYALVKHHDRAGRMTDILEYSNVAIPRDRFTDELLAELERGDPVAARASMAITSSSATCTSSGG